MNVCLFLDDERNPSDVKWVQYPVNTVFYVARNLQEFIDKFAELEPDMVSFDHDLGEDANGKPLASGYACVKWTIEYLFNNEEAEIPEVLFHSKNPVGERNMRLYWKNGVREIKQMRNGEML
jgi:hypothetical protein